MSEVQSLNSRHYLILDMVLAGVPGIEIARKLDMSPSQVSLVIHSPSFQHELTIRRSGISEKVDEQLVSDTCNAADLLRSSATQAAQKLIGLMDSTREDIAQRSAMDILDRAGVPKITRNQNTNVGLNITISDESAMLIKETLLLDKENLQ